VRSVDDQVQESMDWRGRFVKLLRERSRVDGTGKDEGGTPLARQGRAERDREEKLTVRFEGSKADRTSWRAGSAGSAAVRILLFSTTGPDTVEVRGE